MVHCYVWLRLSLKVFWHSHVCSLNPQKKYIYINHHEMHEFNLAMKTTNNHHWPRGKLGNLTGPHRPGRPRCPNVFSLRCTTPALPKRRYRVLSTATPAWVGYGSPMDLHRSMSGCLPYFVTFIACPNPRQTLCKNFQFIYYMEVSWNGGYP